MSTSTAPCGFSSMSSTATATLFFSVAVCICHFCSPAPPRITLCHATKTMFLLNHCNRAFFPVSFRVDPSQAQRRGSSGALPRSGYRKCSRDKNLVGGEHVNIFEGLPGRDGSADKAPSRAWEAVRLASHCQPTFGLGSFFAAVSVPLVECHCHCELVDPHFRPRQVRGDVVAHQRHSAAAGQAANASAEHRGDSTAPRRAVRRDREEDDGPGARHSGVRCRWISGQRHRDTRRSARCTARRGSVAGRRDPGRDGGH